MSIATTERTVQLSAGPIHYYECGTGPVLLFVHGLLVNHALWRAVAEPLSAEFRCIMPDLPLGSHRAPMHPGADLSPTAIAALIAEFIAALDLRDVTLIGNDTGGALCQITITRHPQNIARMVLTNCDCFQHFLPFPINAFQHGARRIPKFTALLLALLRIRAMQRLLVQLVSIVRPSDALLDCFFKPAHTIPGIQHDLDQFLRGIQPRYTLDAAAAFHTVQQPVLIVWGQNDLFFLPKFGIKLAAALPNARLIPINHSRAFVPLDQPAQLADLVAKFVREETNRNPAIATGTAQRPVGQPAHASA